MARRISSGEPTRLQPTRNERTSSEEPQDLGQPPNTRTPSRPLAHTYTHSLAQSLMPSGRRKSLPTPSMVTRALTGLNAPACSSNRACSTASTRGERAISIEEATTGEGRKRREGGRGGGGQRRERRGVRVSKTADEWEERGGDGADRGWSGKMLRCHWWVIAEHHVPARAGAPGAVRAAFCVHSCQSLSRPGPHATPPNSSSYSSSALADTRLSFLPSSWVPPRLGPLRLRPPQLLPRLPVRYIAC